MGLSLSVKNLSKTFPIYHGVLRRKIGSVQAVKNVSFDIKAGESLGIVGESGSGKTTIAKMLAGFIKADSGDARLGDIDLLRNHSSTKARRAQMVFQDPFGSLNPKLLLGTQLKEAYAANSLSLQGEGRGEGPHLNPLPKGRGNLNQLMTDVGLDPDFLKRYPHQLSGGQRQRFAIARAIAANPELLIADEPVSALDLSVQAQIINLLNDLRKKRNLTQIVITHDWAVVSNTCDSVLVMQNGEAMEYGPTEEIIRAPKSAVSQRLINAAAVLE